MVFKCRACGKSMYWKDNKIICQCGSEDYDIVDNMSELTCDICGHTLTDRCIAEVCSNCGAHVINKKRALQYAGLMDASISEEDALKNVEKYLRTGEFSLKVKSHSIRKLYLNYWVVDGTSIVKDDTTGQVLEIEHDDFPVYNDTKKLEKLSSEFTYDTGVKNLSKMKSSWEHLLGWNATLGDDREQVITLKIVQNIQKVDNDVIKSRSDISKEHSDIQFSAKGKMSVLVPMYEVLINNKYKYYVNGQNGDVHGDLYVDKSKMITTALIAGAALGIAVGVIRVILGGALV